MSTKCAGCNKTVYANEKLRCLDKDWHKGCFKCAACKATLNLKSYESYGGTPYCRAHKPDPKSVMVGQEEVAVDPNSFGQGNPNNVYVAPEESGEPAYEEQPPQEEQYQEEQY